MNQRVLEALCQSDKVLGRVIKKIGPIKVKPQKKQSPYEALVEAIVYQQITMKAAATILGRVKALYPENRFPTPDDLLATPDDVLGSIGLFRAKITALKDIASRAANGTLPDTKTMTKMSDAEIIEQLILIKGVGQWTAEMLLIFKLGRPDILPVSDFGVRKGFALVYKKKDLPAPKEILKYGERWKPYRTTATLYLWRMCTLTSN